MVWYRQKEGASLEGEEGKGRKIRGREKDSISEHIVT